jgi:hypothetical protein
MLVRILLQIYTFYKIKKRGNNPRLFTFVSDCLLVINPYGYNSYHKNKSNYL